MNENNLQYIRRTLIASGITISSEDLAYLIDVCEQLEMASVGNTDAVVDLCNTFIHACQWHDVLYALGRAYEKPLNKRKLRSAVGLKRNKQTRDN